MNEIKALVQTIAEKLSRLTKQSYIHFKTTFNDSNLNEGSTFIKLQIKFHCYLCFDLFYNISKNILSRI